MSHITLKGPLGQTQVNLVKYDPLGKSGMILVENKLKFLKKELFWAQKCKGVSGGFFKYLRITGIGYRTFLVGNVLTLKLGFSHFYKVQIPKSVKVFLPEPTLICFYGVDKNQVTQIAAKVRLIKKPSPYKGKGLFLIN